jgi:L-lactate dehydrogenase complex protein LldG
MSDNGQKEFIENIRKSLRVEGKRDCADLFAARSVDETILVLDRIGSRSRSERIGLLDNMIDSAKPLNAKVSPVETSTDAAYEILKLALEKTPEWGNEKSVALWKHPLIGEMKIEKLLEEQNIGIAFSGHPDLRKAASFIGITSADYCVAETATLVLKTAPGRERSFSLLPSIHAAVIKLDQIVADFPELYVLLDRDLKDNPESLDGGMTFITGPSKTADIEATMVHGAHGPRELFIYVVTGI